MFEFPFSFSLCNLNSTYGVQFFETFSHPLAVKLNENNFLQTNLICYKRAWTATLHPKKELNSSKISQRQ